MDKNRKSEKDYSFTEPYGLWEVSTEGDCEGRSTRKLGIFRGNYQDIAFALADKCYYVLWFKKLDETKFNLPKVKTRDSVDILFDDSHSIARDDMVEQVQRVLSTDPTISVQPGRWGGCVKLCSKKDEEDIRQIAIEKMRKTLSEEEMKALGF